MPGAVNFQTIKGIYKGICTGLVFTVAFVAVAFFSPNAGLFLNLCMWVFWAVLSHIGEKTQLQPA